MVKITATKARNDFFNLLKKAIHSHEPICIDTHDGGAILISAADYESLLKTLELLSTPGFA